MNNKKIIFVYNADSGLFNSLKETIHKTFSPSSYQCRLCQITHGAFSVKQDWKDFVDSLNLEVEFFHKDEFKEKYGQIKEDLPNAYVKEKELKLLISSKEMNSAKNVQELKKIVKDKIKELK